MEAVVLAAGHLFMLAELISKIMLASQRNPQSSSIKQHQHIRLVKETRRDEEDLIFHVTLQSTHM